MHAAFTILALVASANAYAYNYTTSIAAPVYETKYVTDLTTVCPSATIITIGSSLTYTVTEATTLTITDCSCTVTNEVPAATSAPATSAAPVESVPAHSSGVVVIPSSVAPYPTAPAAGNGTSVVVPVGTATAPVATTAAPEFTGAASKAGVAALAIGGAALAAFF
jgi:hypothetical protein